MIMVRNPLPVLSKRMPVHLGFPRIAFEDRFTKSSILFKETEDFFLSLTAFKDVGGYDGLVRGYQTAMTNETYRIPNTTCHLPDKNAFRMLREADDDYMPWAGFLLGQTPGSIWYWCADQVIVARLVRT